LDASSQSLCDEGFAPFIKPVGLAACPGRSRKRGPVKLSLKLQLGSIFVFMLIMAGGNITMSLYVLLQLFGLRPDEPASSLFRQEAA
jgi:hypothetical protein